MIRKVILSIVILVLIPRCDTIKKMLPTKNFSVDVPENWFIYAEPHNDFVLSPVFFKKKRRRENKADVYFISYEIKSDNCKCKTIDDVLNFQISKYNKYYHLFKYELIENKHPKYGKIYIIKYSKNKNTTRIVVLIKNKGKQYLLRFSSLNKYYDTYVKDLAEMITSFKVKELPIK